MKIDTHEPPHMIALIKALLIDIIPKKVKKYVKASNEEIAELIEKVVCMKPLETGDYVDGEYGIERKSTDIWDFNDVMAKVSELKNGYPKPFLLIERNLDDLIADAPNEKMAESMKGMLASILFGLGIPIIPASQELAWEIALRGILKGTDGKNHDRARKIKPRPDIGKNDIDEDGNRAPSLHDRMVFILQGMEGVGEKKAEDLIKEYGSPLKVFEAISKGEITHKWAEKAKKALEGE